MKKLAMFLVVCLLIQSIGLTAFADSSIEPVIIDDVTAVGEVTPDVPDTVIPVETAEEETVTVPENETPAADEGGSAAIPEDESVTVPEDETITVSEQEIVTVPEDETVPENGEEEDMGLGLFVIPEDGEEGDMGFGLSIVPEDDVPLDENEYIPALASLEAYTLIYSDQALTEVLNGVEEETVVVTVDKQENVYRIQFNYKDSLHEAYVDAVNVTLLTDDEVAAWEAAGHEDAVSAGYISGTWYLEKAKLIYDTEDGEDGVVNVMASNSGDFVFADPSDKTILLSYRGNAANVTIPNTVKSIQPSAFANKTFITSVNIPNSVTNMGERVFENCTNLRSINIPSGISYIPNRAFYGCANLNSIAWSNSVTSIGEEAFTYCSSLTGLSLPDSITYIGAKAFMNCSSLTDVNFPSSLVYIGSEAFASCPRITDVTLPSNLSSLGVSAFENCAGLTSLTIPASLKEIPNFAFRYCTKLPKVTIPSGVTAIGREAFCGCSSLTHAEIPATVTTIQERAFALPHNGATFYVYAKPDVMGDGCFDKNGTIYGYPGSTTNTFASKNGISFIPIQVVEYVKHCYATLLDRSGEEASIISYVDQLVSQKLTVATLISTFVNGQEFKSKKLSNEEAVQKIYQAMLGRDADSDGKATWSHALDCGTSYNYVINGLAGSGEFKDYCKANYVTPGNITLTENRDKNLKVTEFVNRCYNLILQRSPDVPGLNNWTGQLLNKTKTGAEIVFNFIYSQEFLGRHLSNADVVEILYNTMLGRASDAAGKAKWVAGLDTGASYRYVINGFSGSREFIGLCRQYGIDHGSIAIEPRDRNMGVTGFVSRCYEYALGRKPDAAGLNSWCTQILNKTQTPAQVAYGFVFSKECSEMGLTNTEFVEMLYGLYMGRGADSAGLKNWVNQLNKGVTRQKVVNGFAGSQEFTKIVKSYGL